MSKLYIIIPIFNDIRSLKKLLTEIGQLAFGEETAHVVVVDDGSLKEPTTPDLLRGNPFDVDLLTLRRNVGHQRAISIGICHVVKKGDACKLLVMDGDGEDRPEDVSQLVTALDEENADVVVAQRRKREESLVFKAFYRFYKGIFRILTGKAIQFGNFCAMGPQAAKRLVYMDELSMHFPATIIKSGLNIKHLEVDRGKRYFGCSKMNLVSLITHGLRSVAIFTENVLTRIILFCAVVAASSMFLILVAFAIKLLGFATPGWFTVAVGALLGLLVQTATITLISLLIAMNSRSSAAQIPYNINHEYIEAVELLMANGRNSSE